MNESHFEIQLGDFSAEVALGGEWSLFEFAAFITETAGFDFDHAFEFCDNLKNPYASKERYTLFADMGEGRRSGGEADQGLASLPPAAQDDFAL